MLKHLELKIKIVKQSYDFTLQLFILLTILYYSNDTHLGYALIEVLNKIMNNFSHRHFSHGNLSSCF